MTEALTPTRPRIDHPAELDQLVRRVVDTVKPLAIYLFGSRARGDADRDSDYDLLIVIPDERMNRQVWDDLRAARRNSDLAAELIPTRASGFAELRHEVGTVPFEVDHDGLDRFSDFVWAHRYPEEDLGRSSPPEPSATEARAWIAESELLRSDFEHWLEAQEKAP